jgi:hypothetical protein
MLPRRISREDRMAGSMLGATAGTFFVVAIVALGVILLGYAVYFFFFKKM